VAKNNGNIEFGGHKGNSEKTNRLPIVRIDLERVDYRLSIC